MVTATVTDVVPAVLPGIYTARFDGVEEATNDTGEYWLWKFTLDVPAEGVGDTAQYGEDGAMIPITATSSPRVTPRTKAAQWLGALGVTVTVGDEIDFDTLIGMYCQVIIVLSDTGYSRIDKALPPKASPKVTKEK